MLFQTVLAQTSPTFYFRVGGEVPGCPSVQTFNDGQSYGPCNGGRGVKYGTAESKYYVAIRNAAQYCGQTITATFGSRQIQLKVMDECPGCAKDNHLDMSLEALIELTGSKEIACAINRMPPMINWNFGGKPQDQPVHTPTSTDDEKPTESAKHTTKSAISTVTSLATVKPTESETKTRTKSHTKTRSTETTTATPTPTNLTYDYFLVSSAHQHSILTLLYLAVIGF